MRPHNVAEMHHYKQTIDTAQVTLVGACYHAPTASPSFSPVVGAWLHVGMTSGDKRPVKQ